ncbi:MAG: diguanylate cyclase, partial [Desulfamplus sp.]|nr:diguanylate cyclase [Desulfamplus sp.]
FIFNPRASGIDFYGDTLFTTESQINKHPERVKKFLDASLKGWDYALEHSKEIIDLIYNQYSQRHSYAHLEFEAEKTRQLILPNVVEIGYINSGRWRHIADTYSEMGMAPPNISLRGFIYERNPKDDITWIYLSLFGTVCVAGIFSFIAMRFYNLNRRIRKEMVEKERVSANLSMLEEKYRILVEHAPFPILITSFISEQLMYINPKAVQKLDITQDYAIGKPARNYYVNPEDRDIFLTFLKSQGYVENYEVLMKSASGVQFWASLAATLILFQNEQAIFTALLDITEQKTLEKKLETMAMTDELTGLFNRRNFTQKGLDECQRAKRYNLPLSMMMLDVDKFKSINDTYGHQAGDYVLKKFASLIMNNIRDVDVAGRLGGEEFGLLLPNTDGDYALTLAERLRKAIEQYPFELNGKVVSITASIGVASFVENSVCFDQMLNNADSAMYWSKNSGRNRVARYRESMV